MGDPLKAPNVNRKVALRMLEEALKAAQNEEWDHAYYYANDALIWLEGAYPDN